MAGLHRHVTLALLCLSVTLLLLPLVHHKPGLPATLKADEPAYFLAALSLVKDGDLRCEPRDLARLFESYPYAPVRNLILSTDDGWNTVYFGKPYLFSFLAAPFAAVLGANGLVWFNTLLLVAMIWMTTIYLARYNPDWLAALFSVGFFLMSTTYTYVYWLQPELLNMFSVAACLFFGLYAFGPESAERPGASTASRWVTPRSAQRLALLASSGALALGVYNKPMLAAMGLPVCLQLLRRRRWQDLGVWLAGAALAIGLISGLSVALTGHPTAYLGVDRQGYSVYTPHELPMAPKPVPEPGAGGEEAELGKKTAGWWWIFQIPVLSWAELKEDLVYFFIGRHTGLFLYQPFSLIALGLFFAFSRRSLARWAIFGSIVVVALFFLVFLSHNWHGGGGFVGNRYFLMIYPAFAYLVTRIRPDWAVAAGFAAGGLFIGPLLLSPFGLVVPSPTLQAHARNHPFQVFPLEHSLRELPGYWGESLGGVFFHGRKDHLRPEGGSLWIAGQQRAELWLSRRQPLSDLAFEVTSEVPNNEITLEIGGASQQLVAGPEPQRVMLSPSRPTKKRKDRHRADWQNLLDIYVYRMEVRTSAGEMPRWRNEGAPFFYRGCTLTFLGSGDESVKIDD